MLCDVNGIGARLLLLLAAAVAVALPTTPDSHCMRRLTTLRRLRLPSIDTF